jgi:UDP-N-acetylmuramoyl-L-alanine---L-glutamate ligase
LLNALQKHGPGRFENLVLIAVLELDPVFMRPIPKVCRVRTVAKVISETAAPADEILRIEIRGCRRGIEKRSGSILGQITHSLQFVGPKDNKGPFCGFSNIVTTVTFEELAQESILILGFGTEGQATYDFLRKRWPAKPLKIADKRTLEEFPPELARRIQSDQHVTFNFGPRYLDSADGYSCDVIIKTPGIPASIDAITRSRKTGSILTSHSQLFLSNYPREKVIGITGTKGKSTTASLIHHILRSAGIPAELVGNIGRPPLARIDEVSRDTFFVYEFSSHQLAEIQTSPHIAVLLNIVPEHLDYYATFDEYVAAKENITRFQTAEDFLIFNSDYPMPTAIARRSKATLKPFSAQDSTDGVIKPGEIPLPGKFNLQNVMAAIAVASLCGVSAEVIRTALLSFRPLPHRLEPVGTFNGITFYDDSIATIPGATLAALETLGTDVQTLILGGHERNLSFTELGTQLPPNIRTVILFPPTGVRIWNAIETHSKNPALPSAFFVRDMEQAVKIAYEQTGQGKICLLSPASPSFGAFRDYAERGDFFKDFVRKFSSSSGMR